MTSQTLPAPPPPIDGPGAVSIGGNSPPAPAPPPTGLPPGAVVTPLSEADSGAAASAAAPSGLPPGAVVTPLAGAPQQPGSGTPSSDTRDNAATALGGVLDMMDRQGGMEAAAAGYTRKALKSLTGMGQIIRKIPGVNAAAPMTDEDRQFQQVANGGDGNPAEGVGGFAEGAAEYEALAGPLKLALSIGVKGAEAMKLASTLTSLTEKYPALAHVLGTTAGEAAKGGTQGYVNSGGDTAAAEHEALLAGGIAGGVGGAAAGAGKFVRRIAPSVEKVGGIDHVVPAELRNAKPTPEQVAGQQSIRNAAQGTLRRNLEELNESRAVPDQAPGLPERTGPYEFRLQGTGPVETPGARTPIDPTQEYRGTAQVPNPSHTPIEGPSYTQQERELGSTAGTIPDSVRGQRSPARVRADQIGGEEITPGDARFEGQPTQTRAVFQQTSPGGIAVDPTQTGGGGELRTTDPNVATGHLRNVDAALETVTDPAQRQQLLTARADTVRQLGEYRRQFQQAYPGYGKPNFEPVDIPSEIRKAGSYTDAANTVEDHATDLYNHFNDLTDNRFNAIRQENKDAWTAYVGASGEPAQKAAETALNESNRKMAELMDSIHNAVTPKELDGANDAYRNAQTLHAIASAVDGSFSGNGSTSARSWEYRGFNGTQLMGRLNRVTQKLGRPAVERVMGRDNLDTLYQVARLNMTNAGRAKFGESVGGIAQELLRHRMSGPILAATGGGALGALSGHGYAGAFAGEALYGAVHTVANAIKTNPKVAQNLIFALDAGARPENYMPLIAGMIAQQNKQQTQQQSQGGDQQ